MEQQFPRQVPHQLNKVEKKEHNEILNENALMIEHEENGELLKQNISAECDSIEYQQNTEAFHIMLVHTH